MTIYIVVLSPVSRPMPALPFKRLHAERGGGGLERGYLVQYKRIQN